MKQTAAGGAPGCLFKPNGNKNNPKLYVTEVKLDSCVHPRQQLRQHLLIAGLVHKDVPHVVHQPQRLVPRRALRRRTRCSSRHQGARGTTSARLAGISAQAAQRHCPSSDEATAHTTAAQAARGTILNGASGGGLALALAQSVALVGGALALVCMALALWILSPPGTAPCFHPGPSWCRARCGRPAAGR